MNFNNNMRKFNNRSFQMGKWAMNAEDWGYPQPHFWKAFIRENIGTEEELRARIDARPPRYARIMRRRNGKS